MHRANAAQLKFDSAEQENAPLPKHSFTSANGATVVDIERAKDFHGRRMAERCRYEQLIDELKFAGCDDKEIASHRRLLRQEVACQTLVLIWVASPYSQGEAKSDDDIEITAYGLGLEIARSKREISKFIGYVGRVVEAACACGLVTRTSVTRNRAPIHGTQLLHDLMLKMAT